jgi:lipopolysaccharide/colanic/teichoic acid biosynthesis glycosyltransferase
MGRRSQRTAAPPLALRASVLRTLAAWPWEDVPAYGPEPARQGPPRLLTRAAKRGFDVLVCGAGLLALWPVGLCAAAAVALEDGRPVLYAAPRAGRYGRLFTMYKFRSMRRDAAAQGPAITGARDPRVTRAGRVLRSTRIDELPQLWNVLRGDMSLVGPRPEDPAFAALYTPQQRAVLALRPGITGPAQVVFADEARLLRPGHVHEDYVTRILPAKLAIDLDYVAAPSLGRDLRVLWATARALAATVRSPPARRAGGGVGGRRSAPWPQATRARRARGGAIGDRPEPRSTAYRLPPIAYPEAGACKT